MSSNATNGPWKKAWSGRFEKSVQPLMEKFNASISVDRRMWQADVQGSLAWAKTLAKAGLLSTEEAQTIREGLETVGQEWSDGRFEVQPSDEDIHMAVERRLTELVGDAGAKLHTGRSRNDQVATDFRLHLKGEIARIQECLARTQSAIVKTAEDLQDVIMPGYTHVQQAQPVLFSHYLLSLFWALERDSTRLSDCLTRVDILPLGSGALAGSAFPIDRELLAQELGFSRISENSMDAISDRDHALELVSVLTQIQLHLSRYAEDMIIWSSLEYGFIELDDAWSTGSSMMPQKKNPDSLELVRGKAACLLGAQAQMFSMMKGLPLTYAKDLQEDKAITFRALDDVADSLLVMEGVIETLTVNRQAMESKLDSLLLATDVADYLVRKGIPFRKSHHIVGQLVKWSLDNDTPLGQIPLETYRTFDPVFDESVFELFDWEASLAKRNLPGGTGPESVRNQITQAKAILNS